MAATIARAIGIDRSRRKETHRLGSEESVAEAATWKTFATVWIVKDGSGSFTLKRNGVVLHTWEWGEE